ncbi:MAG: phosphoribosylformylglycinamidine synthase subunit PurQ [Armatimonadota bacterium]|nr:phosphoribosylformylglycinamidine synthase subunit PurQ [Armatimonadota bacterium]MDR7452478.1 phosphoribosylformylglycinamidine synthase subunit PurQ [Armatimonadota bacterium]MDR7467330.1 phosphoribosylformylglycinamidine synthase subunit PurQ [Armatimonadota bacterium]MDR7494101.1 phosphoribosylformylglycinamidine synthase subunit PurQ [Armatimonadota bacterium]MDR7498932.1 phosphoribosylformylglycinamidine synthase subunit PurQ [Armatimonadota bacterium]
MTIGVVVFPGSNCDRDCVHVLRHVLGQHVVVVWHEETSVAGLDAVILPGGFAYGDYLRAGAVAATSPIMAAVRAFAAGGGPVLGICNGFQVLLEAGVLPGAMLRNRGLQFLCRPVHLRVESTRTPFTRTLREGQVLRLPIAHGEGNYYAPPALLETVEAEKQVVFRYCDPDGRISAEANPNGSLRNIAGICSPRGNVLGLMPHPERAAEEILGSVDGRLIFESLLASLHSRAPVTAG